MAFYKSGYRFHISELSQLSDVSINNLSENDVLISNDVGLFHNQSILTALQNALIDLPTYADSESASAALGSNVFYLKTGDDALRITS